MAFTTYFVVYASGGTTPTGAQIVAGQNSSGVAALASGNQAFGALGVETFTAAVTTLAASTSYNIAFVDYDGTATYSNVVTYAFSTLAAGTAVNPGAGTVTLTGYAPTVAQPIGVNPSVGSLTITGYAPTVAQPIAVAPGAGPLTLTGYAPTITQPIAVAPGAGTLTLTGYAPTVAQSGATVITPDVGALALTGYAPTVAQSANQSIAPAAGALTLTGYAPTVTQVTASPNLQPGAGTLTITGYAPSVTQDSPQSGGGGPEASDDSDEHEQHLSKAAKAGQKLYAKAAPKLIELPTLVADVTPAADVTLEDVAGVGTELGLSDLAGPPAPTVVAQPVSRHVDAILAAANAADEEVLLMHLIMLELA